MEEPPRRLPDPGAIGDELRQRLVHTGSGGRHARPDIGQAGQLQQALNGAVLAVFAVQDRENDVDALTHNAVALKIQQALPAHRRNSRAAVLRAMLPLARRQLAVVPAAVQDPFAGLGDADRKDVIFFLVEVVQHGLRRTQRDLMLRGHAAEQHTNTQFFHVLLLHQDSGSTARSGEGRRGMMRCCLHFKSLYHMPSGR